MKKRLHYILMIAFPFCLIASVKNQPEIKLTTSKNHVLPIKLRTSILEVTETCLNRSDEYFIATLKEVKNPYPTKVVEAIVEKKPEITELATVNDEDILKEIQTKFSSQIRGTLSKGDVNYLQLNGGGMLEEGDSFPAKISKINDKSFTVTIQEITPRGYVLKMNDVVRRVNFEKTSGIIRNN